ncbi:unnamed protein product [Cuscuta epithymum]|nr:unnamed protein product [Cuscuta epithymum]
MSHLYNLIWREDKVFRSLFNNYTTVPGNWVNQAKNGPLESNINSTKHPYQDTASDLLRLYRNAWIHKERVGEPAFVPRLELRSKAVPTVRLPRHGSQGPNKVKNSRAQYFSFLPIIYRVYVFLI